MIDAECLSRVFGSVVAVTDVSFHVDAGQTLALVGASGCGKTTTLRLLNRLLEPSSGRVRIGGEDVGAYAPAVLRRQIGYVFQGLGLFPHLTVAENIGITPSLLGWERAEIEQRTDELLRVVGLSDSDLAHRHPDQLSGGQRQRVAVARALAARPRVMLLDEPFGALDPVTRDGLQQTFRQLQREVGFTAVFVTHDVVEACVVADRIAVMDAGRIVQVGTAAELASAPARSPAAALFAMPTRHAQSFLRATGGRL